MKDEKPSLEHHDILVMFQRIEKKVDTLNSYSYGNYDDFLEKLHNLKQDFQKHFDMVNEKNNHDNNYIY